MVYVPLGMQNAKNPLTGYSSVMGQSDFGSYVGGKSNICNGRIRTMKLKKVLIFFVTIHRRQHQADIQKVAKSSI